MSDIQISTYKVTKVEPATPGFKQNQITLDNGLSNQSPWMQDAKAGEVWEVHTDMDSMWAFGKIVHAHKIG